MPSVQCARNPEFLPSEARSDLYGSSLIFVEEAIFPVIDWGTLGIAGQNVVGQDVVVGSNCHKSPPLWVIRHDVTAGDGFTRKECT
jgi:hypothetical protein